MVEEINGDRRVENHPVTGNMPSSVHVFLRLDQFEVHMLNKSARGIFRANHRGSHSLLRGP